MSWVIIAALIVAVLVLVLVSRRDKSKASGQTEFSINNLQQVDDLAQHLPLIAEQIERLPKEEAVKALEARKQELLACFHAPSKEIRAAAAELVSFLGWQEARGFLFELLESKAIEVQLAAVEALTNIGDENVIQRLLDDLDRYLPARAAQIFLGLEEIARPMILEQLPRVEPEKQKFLVEVVGEMHGGTVEAARQLINLLETASPEVKVKCAEALGRLKAIEALPLLIQALESQEVELRNKAAWALGMIGHPETDSALEQALDDKDWTVRASAAKALEQIAAAKENSENDTTAQ